MKLMRCAIFDIDGTLADSRHRDHLKPPHRFGDWSAFFADEAVKADAPVKASWAILRGLASEMAIFFVSGRHERQRAVTVEWLAMQVPDLTIPTNGIYLRLRPDGDRSRTPVYKLRQLRTIMEADFEPVIAAEDDPDAAAMYAENGLSVYACREINKRRWAHSADR